MSARFAEVGRTPHGHLLLMKQPGQIFLWVGHALTHAMFSKLNVFWWITAAVGYDGDPTHNEFKVWNSQNSPLTHVIRESSWKGMFWQVGQALTKKHCVISYMCLMGNKIREGWWGSTHNVSKVCLEPAELPNGYLRSMIMHDRFVFESRSCPHTHTMFCKLRSDQNQ